jgi:hypothetical protein
LTIIPLSVRLSLVSTRRIIADVGEVKNTANCKFVVEIPDTTVMLILPLVVESWYGIAGVSVTLGVGVNPDETLLPFAVLLSSVPDLKVPVEATNCPVASCSPGDDAAVPAPLHCIATLADSAVSDGGELTGETITPSLTVEPTTWSVS